MGDVPNGMKMIHVGLGVVVDEFGPMPVCGHTIDGHQNGRTAVHEQTELLQKHLPNLKLTMISDRGTYSVGHLLRLKDAGCEGVRHRDGGRVLLVATRRADEAGTHTTPEARQRLPPADGPLRVLAR